MRMTSIQTVRIKNQAAAFWKLILSFRKRDWKLNDYPIMVREHKFDPHFSSSRFTQHRHIASIINWTVSGGGETVEEALQDLQINFQAIKVRREREGKPPVRPGIRGPIEFASQELIAVNQQLSEDFVRRVLNLDWAWISDETDLWDFHTDETNELLYSKIVEVYGVDVSDIESARLSEILNRIATTRGRSFISTGQRS
ncbi:hypothetical protein [Acidicapsa acidisoli]|uniref:hypothetical protein n=1 Tax=Acidicapsa acidisoli TaxID=1615681 RepID=UPI0021E05CBC|nr:hypothetical protein [Acidicapsa acidisoli]